MAEPTILDIGPPEFSEKEVGEPGAPGAVDQDQRHDPVRRLLAFTLVGVFALEVFGAFVLLWHGTKVEDIKEIILEVISPTVALTGSALGFYFGTK